MDIAAPPTLPAAALAALLALVACGAGEEERMAGLDDRLLAEGADPALTSALEDQILIDPNLVQQAHPNTVRPPEAPVQAQYPPPAPAGIESAAAATGDPAEVGICADALDRSPRWAERLPAEFPLYPGGRVTEAAGADNDECHIRVVAFQTPDPAERVLGHYRRLAVRAGFAADTQQRGNDHLLGGINSRTDDAFVLVATPLPRGTDVTFIVDSGR